MPTRVLGRTRHLVGILGLGGERELENPDNADVALPIVERALDLGVNYIDTSPHYGGGRWSERYMGQVMKRRRKETFLATMTQDRTADGSMRLLEESLGLLNTGCVDLWQLQRMGSMEDLEKVCGKGGALEAFAKARDQKMTRFLGLAGHRDPGVLAEAIRRFPFDTVLMPVNAADPSFAKDVLPLALEREMGAIGMKVLSRGRLIRGFRHPEPRPGAAPLADGTITVPEAIRYALSHPVSTIIVGYDNVKQMEENVSIARSFLPLSEARLAELEGRAGPVAEQAQYYRKR
jgi:aryl-alcohol dehydrogenase-like predicted oxidoreductase